VFLQIATVSQFEKSFQNSVLAICNPVDSDPSAAIFRATVQSGILQLEKEASYMTDGSDPDRLNALEEKLDAKRQANAPKPVEEHHLSQAQAGWRMVTELVAGLLLGFGLGYGLDVAFGTLPLFLIVFTLLGFAGGVRAMMRSAEQIAHKNAETQD
jgi:ATP synthase protein I